MNFYTLGQQDAYRLFKVAGRPDWEQLKKFTQGLSPGDVINFSANGADVMESGIRKGVSHAGISLPIQQATGSDEHHTALYAGTNEHGQPMIVHNYEQGGGSGLRHEPLHNYADRTSFRAYRPEGITPEQGQAAVDHALSLYRQGDTRYSKRNLVAAGPSAVAANLASKVPQRFPGRALIQKALGSIGRRTPLSAVGENCDPGSGICSALPHEAYRPVLGEQEAIKRIAGAPMDPRRAQTEISPATIKASPNMRAVGQYTGPSASAGGGVRGYLRGGARRLLAKAAPLTSHLSPFKR